MTQTRVLQVCPSLGQRCGIAIFAETLAQRLESAGLAVRTTAIPGQLADADVVLLQHHPDLIEDEVVKALIAGSPCPVVLFAHEGGVDLLARQAQGVITMVPGLVGLTGRPLLVFPHPAWTPPYLEDRQALREEMGMPQDALVVATSGFLRFEREFERVTAALLPHAKTEGWAVDLVLSPWRLPSPGVLEALYMLRDRYGDHLRVGYAALDTLALNRRLQAADLLWCWTKAPSGSYASGVMSDQYASGTRIVAADKLQHEHVLALPNVVRAPDTLLGFTDRLIAELKHGPRQRHDPAPVSWDHAQAVMVQFLSQLAGQCRAGSGYP